MFLQVDGTVDILMILMAFFIFGVIAITFSFLDSKREKDFEARTRKMQSTFDGTTGPIISERKN